MPKGKKKGKFEHRRTEQAYSSDEDAGIDMTLDNCSETSGQSDLKSTQDDAASIYISGRQQRHVDQDWWHRDFRGRKEVDDANEALTQQPHLPQLDVDTDWKGPDKKDNEIEKFEEKLMGVIDSLSARSNAARASALVSLRSALQRRYVATMLANQRATLGEHVSKALRRGRDAERHAAAAIAPLLALQIGDEGTEEYLREVRPALAATTTDKSATLETRAECCTSLAVLCYLLEEDITEILDVMRRFETIFSGSYLKGDGSVKVSGAVVEEGGWHAAALDGWALLLAQLAPPDAAALLRAQPPSFARLAELLEACSLEVRMAAGGALAMAHERITEAEEEPAAGAHVAQLLPRLEQLARDSHKYRAKRDRKVQRATFRDILKYFEENEVPSLTIRVGSESVYCESWSSVAAYGALAGALGAGLQTLAPHALQLRAALGLGDLLPAGPLRKPNKLQRHLQNNAACKARTISRNKSRDKRSAALAL